MLALCKYDTPIDWAEVVMARMQCYGPFFKSDDSVILSLLVLFCSFSNTATRLLLNSRQRLDVLHPRRLFRTIFHTDVEKEDTRTYNMIRKVGILSHNERTPS